MKLPDQMQQKGFVYGGGLNGDVGLNLLCEVKCEAPCFTLIHSAWAEDVYEYFQKLYVLDLLYGNGVNDYKQTDLAGCRTFVYERKQSSFIVSSVY